MTALNDAAGGMLAAMLFGALLLVSHGLARRALPGAALSVRWAGTLGISLWIQVACFWLLAPLGLFLLMVVLAILLVAVYLGSRQGEDIACRVGLIGSDLSAARRFLLGRLKRPSGWPLLLLFVVGLVRCVRGSGSPPLGWDALTYHLVRAGRWVQSGALAPEIAPDAWGYYEHYPFAGDIIWSWVMLPVRGDALLTLGGFAVWVAILLGAYACARSLGAKRQKALLAAGALGASPSILTFLSSAYVDNLSLATFLLGSVFVLRLARGAPLREAPLATGFLGLMLGVKTITAPLFVLGVAVVVWRLRSHPRRQLLLALCVVAALVGSPGYLRSWIVKDSPIYPFGLEIAGKTVFQGNEEVAQVSSGAHLADRHQLGSGLEALSYLLVRRTREGAFVNPGPGAPLILLMGLLGAWIVARRKQDRLAVAYLSACGAVLVALFFSDYMAFSRTTIYVTTVGRFLTPVLGVGAILGASVQGRFASPIWALAMLLGSLWSRPVAWVRVEAPMMLAMAVLLVLALAIAKVLSGIAPARLRGLLALLGIGLLTAGLVGLRNTYRYDLWAAATHPREPLFHMHRLNPLYAAAWPIWRHFDGDEELILASTAGWDGQGHNWYRYPLMGSRLQNEVIYVPLTADASVIDYRLQGQLEDQASFPDWGARLLRSNADFVLTLAPRNTIEDRWLRQATGLFTLEIEDPAGLHAAFRLEEASPRAAKSTD